MHLEYFLFEFEEPFNFPEKKVEASKKFVNRFHEKNATIFDFICSIEHASYYNHNTTNERKNIFIDA